MAMAAISMKVQTLVEHHDPDGWKNFRGKIPENSSDSYELILDRRHIVINYPKSRKIYDLERRQIYDISDSRRVIDATSLYSVAGFKVLELQNREIMRNFFAEMKKDAKSSDEINKVAAYELFDAEQELAVSRPDSPTRITSGKIGDKVVYTAEGRELAVLSSKGFTVSPSEAELFARVLRYAWVGHPQILDQIAKGQRIPQSMKFKFRSGWEKTMTMTISDLHTVDEVALVPTSYTNAYDDPRGTVSDDLLKNMDVLVHAHKLDNKTVANIVTGTKKDFDQAVRAKQNFPALLANLELGLMGMERPPIHDSFRQALLEDGHVRQYVQALRPGQGKEDMQKAADLLVELRLYAGEKEYMLKVFEADIRSQIGELEKPKELLREVLSANPALAGVYKDYGDLFIRSYQTDMAWRFWDAGRRLAPDFKNFDAVNQLERMLVEKHPEYF
jgi:hypothetical protein